MKKRIFTVALLPLLVLPIGLAKADGQVIDQCVEAVKTTKAGEMYKLESLTIDDKFAYQFEMVQEDDVIWNVLCDAATAEIMDVEREVDSADDDAFKEMAKISEDEAVKTALDAHLGEVKEVEYVIKENGHPAFDVDTLNEKGIETKVKVDAVSGEIIEVAIENWEVGEEEHDD